MNHDPNSLCGHYQGVFLRKTEFEVIQFQQIAYLSEM